MNLCNLLMSIYVTIVDNETFQKPCKIERAIKVLKTYEPIVVPIQHSIKKGGAN